MSGSNLPPGVTEGMIPGNRPEDADFEQWCERILKRIEETPIERGAAKNATRLIEDGDLFWCLWEAYEMGIKDAAATRRQQLAASAMQGLMANPGAWGCQFSLIANHAYGLADAMIEKENEE